MRQDGISVSILRKELTMKRNTLILMLVTCFVLSHFSATSAQEASAPIMQRPSTAAKIADLLIVRPLSIVVASASTGIFLGTVPFTFLAGVSEPAAMILVEAPWRYTNCRCLGDWSHFKDRKPITSACEEGCP